MLQILEKNEILLENIQLELKRKAQINTYTTQIDTLLAKKKIKKDDEIAFTNSLLIRPFCSQEKTIIFKR